MNYLSGDALRKFIARHGNLPPIRTNLDPNTMTQMAVVKVGKAEFYYSVFEANEYVKDEKLQIYTERFDKMVERMKNKEMKEE